MPRHLHGRYRVWVTTNTVPPGSINVKDAPYNAVGDGAADDTTPDQTAITAAGVIGGGQVVYSPAGTYLTDKLIPANNTELRGPTTIGSPRPTAWTATLKHAAEAQSHLRVESKHDLKFRYMAFDGNGAAQSAGRNLYFLDTYNVLFESCQVLDYWKNTSSDFPAIQTNNGCYNVQILNGTAVSCDALAVIGYGTYNSLIDNCLVDNSAIAGRSETVAFYNGTAADPATHDNACTNCTFVHCKTAVAFQGYSPGPKPTGNISSDGVFTNCAGACLFDYCEYCTFTRNAITAGAFSTGHGINVTAICGAGNVITYNTLTGWTALYPMYIRVPATIHHNILDACENVRLHGDSIVWGANTITNGVGVGIIVQDAHTDITISDGTISGGANDAIRVTAAQTNMTISGNTCLNNGGTYGGIRINAAGTYHLTGNHCHGNAYGVWVHPDATGTYTADNDMTGNTNPPNWGGLTAV